MDGMPDDWNIDASSQDILDSGLTLDEDDDNDDDDDEDDDDDDDIDNGEDGGGFALAVWKKRHLFPRVHLPWRKC